MKPPVRDDPWQALRRFTPARIALGRSGASLPTAEWLRFGIAHAQARDAVHAPFDADALAAALRADGFAPVELVHSAAADRASYLRRPDLGRRLDEASAQRLRALGAAGAAPSVAIVVADGLSAAAVQSHALPLLAAARPLLEAEGFAVGPVVVASQARVALGDAVGEALGAQAVAVLIGERPGLSSPDSLGVYLTWAPRIGCTDAARNCISNVRPAGLAPAAAARTLAWLFGAARRLGATGVALKDESGGGASALADAAPDALSS